MVGFISILVKCILKMLLKIYDGFCVMMDFPYELFVLLNRSSGHSLITVSCVYYVDTVVEFFLGQLMRK